MHASAPTRLLTERRFPLDLSQSILSIRTLYETGKQTRWEPERDVPWSTFDAKRYDADTLAAARRVWSRRAWIEYTGLAETPALLIRFCLEPGREADPKYFLAVRNTEEAWHVECFHRMAELCGGYLDRPLDRAWEEVINQTLYRQALDADQALDTYVATHCALEDGLELELYDAYSENARDAVVKALLDRVLQAKKRHASFGWLYLESRAAHLSADERAATAKSLESWLFNVAFAGYHIPTLATRVDSSAEATAERRLAAAGLGGAAPDTEESLFIGYIGRARERLGELGIKLAPLYHDRLGAV